jgi:hypothetical protein
LHEDDSIASKPLSLLIDVLSTSVFHVLLCSSVCFSPSRCSCAFLLHHSLTDLLLCSLCCPFSNVRIGTLEDHQQLAHVTLLVDGHVIGTRRSGGRLDFTGFLAAVVVGFDLRLDKIVGFSGRVGCELGSTSLKRSKISDTRLSGLFFEGVYKLVSRVSANNRGWTLYR